MKRILAIALSTIVLAGRVSDKNTIFVDCTFDQPYTGMVYVRHFAENRQCLDSVAVTNQTAVSFRQSIDRTDSYTMSTEPYAGTCYFIGQAGAEYKIAFNTETNEAKLLSHTSSEESLMEEFKEKSKACDEVSVQLAQEYDKAMKANDLEERKLPEFIQYTPFE